MVELKALRVAAFGKQGSLVLHLVAAAALESRIGLAEVREVMANNNNADESIIGVLREILEGMGMSDLM